MTGIEREARSGALVREPATEVEARPAPQPGGPLDAFRSRDYSLLFTGTMLTQAANWMQQVAQQWLLYTLSNSPFILGLAGFARASPMLFFSLFGGVLADRFDRRLIIVASQAFACLVAVFMWLVVALNVVEVWQVLLAAFLTGGAMAINGPARQALVPGMVDRRLLGSAVALTSAGQNATRVVGPSIGGLLIQAVGVSVCFLIQAGFMLWALLTSLQMRVPPTRSAAARRGSALDNLKETWGYIRQSPLVAGQLWLATIPSIFAYNYLSLLPVFARDVLHGDSSTFGLLMAANGAGAVVGSIWVAMNGGNLRSGYVLLGLGIAYDALLAGFGLSTSLPLSWALLAGCGFTGSSMNSLNNTILQEIVPDELRGRVMSAYMLTWGFMPLGALPAGFVAEFYGAPFAIVLSNVICAGLLVLLGLKIPELRRVEEPVAQA